MRTAVWIVFLILAVERPAFASAEATADRLVGLSQHEGHQPARPQAKTEPQPQPEKVLGWEPIRCWRQSSAGAVTIGQTFTLVLTCAVYEGDNAQARPDESRLGVASIQLAPFEIVGGSHPPDVRRGSRRFFQYEYQLRVISPDAIGNDVNIPPLTISYRIQSRVGAAASLEGRDLSYVMPMMPIKVLSLVPAEAADIRDASEASLAAVDSLRFRSSLFRVLTITFGALAAVMIVLALVPLARTRTAGPAAEHNRIPDRAVLSRASEELAELQSRAGRGGWDDELVSRTLSTIRIVTAAAAGHANSQKPVARDEPTPDGRLLVRHGTLRPLTAAVSSSITADEAQRARQAGARRLSTTRQQQLEKLEGDLGILNAALYRKLPARDGAALDAAASYARGVAREIAAERSWWNSLRRRGFNGQTIWARR